MLGYYQQHDIENWAHKVMECMDFWVLLLQQVYLQIRFKIKFRFAT